MKQTLHDIALEYGRNYTFRVFDQYDNFLFEKTASEILDLGDDDDLYVEKVIESKIYIHLVYIYIA